jgi:hypothetical protein
MNKEKIMTQIKAIRNHVIFQFLDSFSNRDVKQFAEKTDWGFEVVRHNDSMERGRWVKVVAVGHEADKEIQPGMHVLLEPLKWTQSFDIDGEEYWRSDSSHVLAIDEDTLPA